MARSTRILAAAIAVGLLALPVWGAGFSDLPGGSSRAVLATLLAQRGILPGLSDSEFGGSAQLDRYELATCLNALLDPGDNPFNVVAWSDIPSGHPAMLAVSRVTSLNLLSGTNGRFQGLQRVTRLEFLESLVRLLNYRAVSAPPRRSGPAMSFNDVSAASEAGRTLDRAANFWQLIEGLQRARFRPFDRITRFEALDMLARTLMLLDPSAQATIKAALAPELTPPPPTPGPVSTPSPMRTPYPRPTRLPVWPGPTPHPIDTPEPHPTTQLVATPAPTWTPAPLLTPTPAPTPRRPFWASEATATVMITVSPTPTPEPTVTPIPQVVMQTSQTPGGDELLRNKGRFGLGVVLYLREGVPADTSLISSNPTDKSDLQAVTPGFLNLDTGGTYWLGNLGGALGLTTVFPIQTSLPNSPQLADITVHAEGLYKLPFRGATWQAAGGLGVLERYLSGSGSDYLSTSKNMLGVGPAALCAVAPIPKLTVTTGLQVYPVIVQSYSLGSQDKSAMRFGTGWQVAGDYELLQLGPTLVMARVAYQGSLGTMYDGSALQTVHTVSIGAGGRF